MGRGLLGGRISGLGLQGGIISGFGEDSLWKFFCCVPFSFIVTLSKAWEGFGGYRGAEGRISGQGKFVDFHLLYCIET